jgi:putative membrane protein
MRNLWTLFRTELPRLFANALSIVITIGLVILPSLFSWYNVLACWDVFGNTGNLKVAVANADAGYESDLVPLRVNVGDQVVSALRANDQIGWVFTDEEDAVDGARSGRYYAAVVIPTSFSQDMLTFYTDGAEKAQIVYYSNGKKNAIAPKITDQGADTISYQVNEAFAKTLSEVSLSLADALSRALDDADASGAVAALSRHLDSTAGQMSQAANVLDSFAALTDSSRNLAEGSADLMAQARDQAKNTIGTAKQGAAPATSLAGELSQSVQNLSSALDASTQAFAEVSQNVDAAFDATGATAEEIAAQLRANAEDVGGQAAQLRAVLDSLQQLRDSLPADQLPVLDGALSAGNAAATLLESVQSDLNASADSLNGRVADANSARADAKADAQAAQQALDSLKSQFEQDTKPTLEKTAQDAAALYASIEQSAQTLDSASESLAGSVGSVGTVLGETHDRVSSAASTLRSAAQNLQGLSQRVDEALESGDTEQLRGILESDVQTLSNALAAPVSIERTALYPVQNFGSAMAPLYTTLALFIGSLLILVAVRPKPSAEAVAKLSGPKPAQLFLGHFGLVAILSLCQSTVMGAGSLLFLHVQAVHPLLYLLCLQVTGLVFAFLVYSLVAAFANLGKAIAVLLLVVQVTGCGGSYPLQIMPWFVQAVSPYLPATHAVNAMRAAMMGTYGNDYWTSLGTLLLFLIPAAVIGLVLRKPLSRFMDWFVHHAEASKLVE